MKGMVIILLTVRNLGLLLLIQTDVISINVREENKWRL